MGRWRDGVGALVVVGADGGGVRVPLEIASSYRARTKGLLGRDSVDGAMLLSPAGSVHTFRMRMAIDVAYLDRRLTVIAVRTMRPGRGCRGCGHGMCWRRRPGRWVNGVCGWGRGWRSWRGRQRRPAEPVGRTSRP
ncbi:hypothetical protein STENM36S_03302 [Streptomyces tendae]